MRIDGPGGEVSDFFLEVRGPKQIADWGDFEWSG